MPPRGLARAGLEVAAAITAAVTVNPLLVMVEKLAHDRAPWPTLAFVAGALAFAAYPYLAELRPMRRFLHTPPADRPRPAAPGMLSG